jgi:hypothetical protein
VRCAGQDFALKSYPPKGQDRRDRAGTEFRALRFLERHCPGMAPRAFAVDAERGFGLMEWIEGAGVAAVGRKEAEAALAFLGAVRAASAAPEAQDMPLASEACLSAAELVRQLDARQTRLTAAAATDPLLARFLEAEFLPFRDRAVAGARQAYTAAGLDFDTAIEPGQRSLIPADFGMHNALRRADGSIVFIDHEYFGWDDPVKVTADFLLHPARRLSPRAAPLIVQGMVRNCAQDGAFLKRLKILYALFGARWCLILLNEFLPERWAVRAFARGRPDWQAAKRVQLRRARRMLDKVRGEHWGFFDEQ